MSIILNTLSDPTLTAQLQAGVVTVIPTDTVYGVACMASLPDAVSQLYKLKSREAKPGTLIAASVEQLVELGIKARYLKPVEQYWPGAISVVVPSEPQLRYLDQGVGTLAVRVVAEPELVALLERCGPLLTSSANQPGEPPATNITQAQGYFGDEVAVYVDGGDLINRQPSTIIRVVDDMVEVLRSGAVAIDEAGQKS